MLVLFTGRARNSREGGGGRPGARPPPPRAQRSAGPAARQGSRRCGAQGSEDRGAGAGAAPRQEGERGPCPGARGGRPAGGARPGAEPGAVPAGQALGARGRESPAIPRDQSPFGVPAVTGTAGGLCLHFLSRGAARSLSEPAWGPQVPAPSPGGALSPLLWTPPCSSAIGPLSQTQCRPLVSGLGIPAGPQPHFSDPQPRVGRFLL